MKATLLTDRRILGYYWTHANIMKKEHYRSIGGRKLRPPILATDIKSRDGGRQ